MKAVIIGFSLTAIGMIVLVINSMSLIQDVAEQTARADSLQQVINKMKPLFGVGDTLAVTSGRTLKGIELAADRSIGQDHEDKTITWSKEKPKEYKIMKSGSEAWIVKEDTQSMRVTKEDIELTTTAIYEAMRTSFDGHWEHRPIINNCGDTLYWASRWIEHKKKSDSIPCKGRQKITLSITN